MIAAEPEIDFKIIAKNLEAHFQSLGQTACPRHQKVKLSCICLNPDCRQTVLCSKCVIDDLEHYKTCGKKQQIYQMADLKSQYGPVLLKSSNYDLEGLKLKLNTLRESAVQFVHQKIASEITTGIDSQINKIFETVQEKQQNLSKETNSEPVKANNETTGLIEEAVPETDEWELINENEEDLSADMFFDLELTEFMSI